MLRMVKILDVAIQRKDVTFSYVLTLSKRMTPADYARKYGFMAPGDEPVNVASSLRADPAGQVNAAPIQQDIITQDKELDKNDEIFLEHDAGAAGGLIGIEQRLKLL